MRIRLLAGILLASVITAIVVGYVLPAGASGQANRPPVGGPGPVRRASRT